MADVGGEETSLEFTPTWVVALVCFSILFISITVDRFFRCAGQLLKNHQTWLLIGASRKIKDELMLLGFISLLLVVFETSIGKICISEQLNNVWLPCKKPNASSTVANFTTSAIPCSGTRGRRLLALASATTDYCSQKGKVPLLSVEAVHHLHIFIFVLATSHVVLCLLKVLSMINQWRWLKIYDAELKCCDHLQDLVHPEIKKFYEKPSDIFVYMKLVTLKVITSMSLSEYIALRVNFIEARDPKVTGEDFQKYIMRTLQKEFEKMIGISWYLWLFAVIYLLVNVADSFMVDSPRGIRTNTSTKPRWHALFWISFMPLILWLIVNFKLDGTVRRLAKNVAEKHAPNGKVSSEIGAEEMVVQISDNDFWFSWPHLIGILIHIVLFENSLELTFFFFILFQYGFHSCIMGKVGFVVPRIVIGVFVQVLCISRTLPLYAIIKSQMHLKEKQSDKQKKRSPDIEKIKMLLKENQLDERIKECLHDLDEIKIRLEENEMEEEEEIWIVTWISKWTDIGKKPSSTEEATNIESNRTGSKAGSAGVEITESGDMNSTRDIEAQIDNQAGTNIEIK